jgi:two-component system, cell cycle response regulator CpdR
MEPNSRILVVDDEPQIRTLLSLVLERAGYMVRTARNGRVAIALMLAEHFDIVLSDVMMPEMDGHELVRWVAVHHPSTRTALMSGWDGVEKESPDPSRCQSIAKPFQCREVVSFVAQVLTAA